MNSAHTKALWFGLSGVKQLIYKQGTEKKGQNPIKYETVSLKKQIPVKLLKS